VIVQSSPPEDVDLLQWLTDNYLVGEKRLPDQPIAGLLPSTFAMNAVRNPRRMINSSFARKGQLYLVTIGHTSEVEDWELNNRFLQSIQFTEPAPAIKSGADPHCLAG